MSNIYDFYSKILNIKDENIENVVSEKIIAELDNIKEINSDISGFCRVIGINLYDSLKKDNINVIKVDLNDLIKVDHLILLVKYYYNNEDVTLLIDPTFSQFVPKDNKKLIKFKNWPGNKISSILKEELLNKGYLKVNNERFNDYLNAFLDVKEYFSLEEIFYSEKSKELDR